MDVDATKELLNGVQILFEQRGGQKEAVEEEMPTIDFAFATVVSIAEIKKGEVFSKDNIWVKRPGTGEIKAEFYNDILGKQSNSNIPFDHHLAWENVKK